MESSNLISQAQTQDAIGLFAQFAPLILVFVVFYFLLIRPQQQKQRDTRNMLSSLKRGDRVVTGGGIVGTVQHVTSVRDSAGKEVAAPEIEVEIAPNLRVVVLRETIMRVVKSTASSDTKPSKRTAV